MRYLVTGTAGFIGFNLAKELLSRGHEVVGIDNFSDYYDVVLKENRNKVLRDFPNFAVHRIDLVDAPAVDAVFHSFKPQFVIDRKSVV